MSALTGVLLPEEAFAKHEFGLGTLTPLLSSRLTKGSCPLEEQFFGSSKFGSFIKTMFTYNIWLLVNLVKGRITRHH